MDSETKQYIEGILCVYVTVFRHDFHTNKITGILTGGADDFESGDDLYDAIGDLLHEIAAEKGEDDIRYERFPISFND